MRQASLLCVALSAALFVLGCGQTALSPEAQRADAKRKSKDAADESAAATTVKEDFVRDVRKQLDAFDKKYAELRQRAAEVEGAAKKDLERKVADAKVKRDEALRKLDALNDAGGDHWLRAKDEMANALAELKKAFE